MPAQDFVATSAEELAGRTAGARQRFAALLRSVGPDLVVGGWASRDVLVHVVNVVNRYNEFAPERLADAPRGVDEINRRELEAFDDRPIEALLDVLDAEMEAFDGRWGPTQGLPLDAPLPFHGGATIDVQSGLTNLLAEYLVHGFDVARAAGRDWVIDERDGALLCGFATQILPSYLRATNTHTVSLCFELDGVEPWLLAADGPRVDLRPPNAADEPDVVVAGSPVAAALVFYGRATAPQLEDLDLRAVDGARPELLALVFDLFERP
ncbi:MAG: hypothetical protein MUF83_07170 [Acidimicrobiales bacterium]|jgi:uncharacterized protein (TIGR03083 family)|nr:hypothetical protein [Acidimicrobiales bacterium]